MNTYTSNPPKLPRINWKTFAWAAPVSIVFSIAINLILYYIGVSANFIHHDLQMPEGGKQITEIPTITATLMGMVLGYIIFILVAFFTAKPFKVFLYIAVIALLLSFITPFVLPGISIKMAIWLNLMHITAFIIMLLFLKRFVIR